MTAKYLAILTNQGAARLANAAALGTKVNLTQMAVGDANGVLPTPDPAQTALINRKRIAPINLLSIDPTNTNQIIAEQIIPEDEGGWWIREIGLYDSDGVLIAVANCPETYKPQLQEGSGRTQTIRMILIVSSAAAVTLKIDPSVVLATRKYVDDKVLELNLYVDDLMAKHLAAADPHTQYAPKESPTLTGTPKAPTATAGNNSTQIANTAFVQAVVTALNNALALKAPLASPGLTGTPTAPTAAQTANNTQIATTAFVKSALAGLVGSSPAALDTLNELAAALGNDPNFSTTVMNALAGKQPLNGTLTDLSGKSVAGILEYLGLVKGAVITDQGTNIYGKWRRFSDGSIELLGFSAAPGSDGMTNVVFPIALPGAPNPASVLVAQFSTAIPTTPVVTVCIAGTLTSTGFQAKTLTSYSPTGSGFSWRVMYAAF
ncbi:phage tail protein [Pseudescherichia sp.]|uniref:phage tail protein n=1 Tax=Pseudescherichia sp. TaxID=2055881 RepID=UPI002897113A|nr:phage tail protein [Pseudescherichia sp.]